MNAADRWDSLIQYWTEKNWPDVDWRLIKCQVRRESAFNPLAVSPCGAIGLMQIMPATGQYLGVSRDNLFAPEINLKAGITYLKQLTERRYLKSKIKTDGVRIKHQPDGCYFNTGSCVHPLSISGTIACIFR